MSAQGLYVHIPFCIRKCPYCDFNSYPMDPDLVKPYMEALLKEAERRVCEGPVTTAYFGGGTPTCLDTGDLVWVVGGLLETLGLPPDAEITVEANPGTLDLDKARLLREIGINRISLGFQSLDDGVLSRIGRVHTAREALESFQSAREAGFREISVDLMSGLPGQTAKVWGDTLHEVLRLRPEHISVYPLKVEEGTEFFRQLEQGSLCLPTEEEEASMDVVLRALLQAGYDRYEISNYCLPGHTCRHNLGYWRNLDYMGIGAGAHSHRGSHRWWNLSSPREYVEGIRCGNWVEGHEELSLKEQMAERVILALRTTEGLRFGDFQEEFGVSLEDVYEGVLSRLFLEGLVEVGVERFSLTDRGFEVANRVFIEFM